MTRTRARLLATSLSCGLLVTLAPVTATAAGGCGTYSGRGCAPRTDRVDLDRPVFTHPTDITNPLFPISDLHSALLLGRVDGKPFRTETTLLPGESSVVIDGQRIPVLVSQYMAFLDGRLEEVALDRYAQADDGSAWYLGEDVFDYRRGTVVLTEGTWLAGRDGPAAMIMPASPAVGDVFRPENVPGVVFEEVTVRKVGQTVDGPFGPVTGAVVTSELHLDGSREAKVFAPGYGEFRTGGGGGGDLEAMALAVPTDAATGPLPARLVEMTTAASGALESVNKGDWQAARAAVRGLRYDWRRFPRSAVPVMVAPRLEAALDRLADAVSRKRPGRAVQQSIRAWQLLLDLHLRYEEPVAVDTERFVLWTQQLRLDAARGRAGAVAGDVGVLEWIRDRLTGGLTSAGLADVDARLANLRTASDAGNLAAAADHASRLAARLRDLDSRRNVRS